MKSISLTANTKVSAPILCLAIFSFIGCGENNPTRIRVFGDITWKGQPIPSGYITFSPDVTQGNSGPQGIAWIKDGKFDTKFAKGRGSSLGPQVTDIYGYDGVNPTEEHPWGSPLFVRHQTTITVKEPPETLSLVVPDTVALAPR
jgi:hypothetical protein